MKYKLCKREESQVEKCLETKLLKRSRNILEKIRKFKIEVKEANNNL